jgi:hypothetical protein
LGVRGRNPEQTHPLTPNLALHKRGTGTWSWYGGEVANSPRMVHKSLGTKRLRSKASSPTATSSVANSPQTLFLCKAPQPLVPEGGARGFPDRLS